MNRCLLFFAAIAAFLVHSAVYAQQDYGFTNTGTEFVFSFPVAYQNFTDNGELAVYVTSEVAVPCRLTIPGLGITMVKMTKPYGTIEFNLQPSAGQIYLSNDESAGALSESESFVVGRGRAIQITAPAPVSVTAVSRMVYSSGSFTVLPVSALGQEYIISSAGDFTGKKSALHLPAQAVLAAAHDNTEITFTLGGSTGTRTLGGLSIGQTSTYSFNKGDVIIFATKKDSIGSPDISGSKIQSNKPLAVLSGNQCANIPSGDPSCDFIAEMEVPTHAWGKEYHVPTIHNRKNYSFLKIIAKEPNTNLYRDGSSTPFATLTSAGGKAITGLYEGRVLNTAENPRPVIIRADKPINVMQFNPGYFDDTLNSDPFQLSLSPVEQYQKEILFSTPGLPSSGGFKDNFLVVVSEADQNGNFPDNVELAMMENGKPEWQQLASLLPSEVIAFKKFPGDNKSYLQKTIQLPGDGTYGIRSTNAFAAYQYGTNDLDGYAHTAGLSVKNIFKNDSLAPTVGYTLDCNGNVFNGEATDRTGNELSNISSLFLLPWSDNYSLKTNFISGIDQNASWDLITIDPAKPAIARLFVADAAGNDSVFTIHYTPLAVDVSTRLLTFEAVRKNQSTTSRFSIRNLSDTIALNITSLTFKNGSKFSFAAPITFPFILAPGQSRSFEIAYISAENGQNVDSIFIGIDHCIHSGIHLLAYTGTGLIQAADVSFGTVPLNQMASKYFFIKNSGALPLHIIGIKKPALAEFSTLWRDPSENDPFIIQSGETRDFHINFISAVQGEFRDSVVFYTDGQIPGADSVTHLHAIASGTVSAGTEENSIFTITPNPATGFATITLPAFKSRNVFLKVFDAAGNEVADFSNDLFKTEFRFNTKNLPNGAYFLRFTDGKTTLSRSFIIQN